MIFLALLRYFLYFSISASFVFLASSREDSWVPRGVGEGGRERGEGGERKKEEREERGRRRRGRRKEEGGEMRREEEGSK